LKKNFNKFLNSNSSNYKDIYQKIKNEFEKIKHDGSLDLNRDDNYLIEIFNKNSFLDLDLFWNYALYYFFVSNSIEYMYFNKNFYFKFYERYKTNNKRIK